MAWMEDIAKVPEVRMVIGAMKFNKSPIKIEFLEKPKEEKEKQKEEEPKKEEKKKEEKGEKKKKKKEEDDNDDVPKEEEKEPLDLLPPSKFNLNDFKYAFFAAPDRRKFLQEKFYKDVDLEGYAIWHLHYEKLKGECTVLFKTCNLMNGFIQKIESKGRYGFGVHTIVGDEPNLEIKGVWMLRSTEIPKFVKEGTPIEFYKVRKLDITKEGDRKLIEDYWCCDDGSVLEGLKYKDGKYFR